MLTSCDALVDPTVQVVTIEVAPAMVRCLDFFGERDCMQVRERPDGEWGPLYEGIKGFEYEPGFRYVLWVAIRKIADPPADGSNREFSLRTQLSKRAEPSA